MRIPILQKKGLFLALEPPFPLNNIKITGSMPEGTSARPPCRLSCGVMVKDYLLCGDNQPGEKRRQRKKKPPVSVDIFSHLTGSGWSITRKENDILSLCGQLFAAENKGFLQSRFSLLRNGVTLFLQYLFYCRNIQVITDRIHNRHEYRV